MAKSKGKHQSKYGAFEIVTHGNANNKVNSRKGTLASYLTTVALVKQKRCDTILFLSFQPVGVWCICCCCCCCCC